MSGHALLAPSASHRWIHCPGSVALCQGIPDRTSEAAAEGTAAHQLAEWTLRNGVDSPSKYPDLEIVVTSDDGVDSFTFPVNDHMVRHVQAYVDEVRRDAAAGELFVEGRVDLSDILGVQGQGGTSDAIVLSNDGAELIVYDLKYGKGVQVFAEGNPQLRLYGLGALEEYDLAGTIENVRMVIVQPRLDHIDDEVMSAEALREFGATVARPAAIQAADLVTASDGEVEAALNPGEDQCRFCPAKATCPALRKLVHEAVFDDLTGADGGEDAVLQPSEDAAELGRQRSLVPLIESWCKAVVSKVDGRLATGEPVEGWKLVEGRRGARSWDDPEAVEKMLKGFRLKRDEMYDQKLISPTKAKDLVSEKRWEKLAEHITQKEGKPQAVPESDKREALDPSGGFDNIDESTNEE